MNNALIYLTLYCIGGNFDPKIITDIVGESPTRSRQKGVPVVISSSNKTLIPKHSFWTLTQRINEDRLLEELESFLKIFKKESIDEISLIAEDVFFDLYIGLSNSEEGRASFQFAINGTCFNLLKNLAINLKISYDSGFD